jgi:hypothetical protein
MDTVGLQVFAAYPNSVNFMASKQFSYISRIGCLYVLRLEESKGISSSSFARIPWKNLNFIKSCMQSKHIRYL